MNLYSNKWGPYMNREHRRIVIVRLPTGKKKTMSYARYLMEIHLDRYLSKDETVDHIDNNKLNNKIENLQLLSRAENIIKSIIPAPLTTLNCKHCGREFKRSLRAYWRSKEQGIDGPFCSKICIGKVHH